MQLNQTRAYFWIKDGKKAVHVDVFADKLGLKKRERKLPTCLDTDTPDKSVHYKNVSSHLGHLDHIGELSQTGNRDHIMVGFQFGPGEVIKQSTWSEDFSEPIKTGTTSSVMDHHQTSPPSFLFTFSLHLHPHAGLNSPSVTLLWKCWQSL